MGSGSYPKGRSKDGSLPKGKKKKKKKKKNVLKKSVKITLEPGKQFLKEQQKMALEKGLVTKTMVLSSERAFYLKV